MSRPYSMKEKGKVILRTAIWFTVLAPIFFSGKVMAADLKYIRIGEHKDYTRIVFEFRGSVSFNEPRKTDEGTLRIAFMNTTTALPDKIDSETSKRVNAIIFNRLQKDLVASVKFAFPSFTFKTLSLSEPVRVVLDVIPTSIVQKDEAQGKIVEESLQKDTAASSQDVQMPQKEGRVPLGRKPAKNEPELQEEGVPLLQETPSVSEKEIVPISPEDRPEDFLGKSAPEPIFPALETETTGQNTLTMPDSEMASDEEKGFSLLGLVKEGRMERYLLSALVFVSAVVVGLLVFINLKKKRRMVTSAVSEERYDMFDALDFTEGADGQQEDKELWDERRGDLGKRIASIDTKIHEALNKL